MPSTLPTRRALALLLAAALGACSDATSRPAPSPTAPAPADSAMALFNFDGSDAADWFVVNDGVMGGDSRGRLETEGGALVFTGELVTEGGGFTSARVERGADLSAFDGLEARVRGGGRTFELEVNDATRNRQREVSRRAPFPTTADWRTVRVGFADLDATAFGEPVDAGPLDRAGVESFGFFIADGQDGPFRLEVDWVRPYADGP